MNGNTKNKTTHIVLVIVAHPDDESFGLGATIAKHVENGDIVYAMSMTDGVSARDGMSEKEAKIRAQASINAGNILGLTWIEGESFPDNAMDTIPLLAVAKIIEKAKVLVRPTIVYTHSSADLNIDHRIVSQATLIAFRPQPNEVWQEIRTFEIASATDYGHKSITNLFYPNLYVDIKHTWNKKLAALNEYKMELREVPHSRSIEGLENLAKYRGAQAGLFYAEAFEIIRKIER
ncbi:thiol_BshB1, bacillithiol biosynthesis deacetylase BshB1 [Methylophilaceae bacterium]